MTAMDLTLYWTGQDWAGFLLVLVPAGKLPGPPEELRQRVRAQIETDTYETMIFALAPPFEPTPDWDRAFTARLIEAAMPDRHFFAPRGVIGVVAVGDREREVQRAYDYLKDLMFLIQLGAQVTNIGIQTGLRRAVSPTSVARIADLARGLVTLYAEEPNAAIAEPEFLDVISQQIQEQNLYLPSLLPPGPTDELPAGAIDNSPTQTLGPPGTTYGDRPAQTYGPPDATYPNRAPQTHGDPAGGLPSEQRPAGLRAARPEASLVVRAEASTRTVSPGRHAWVIDPPSFPSTGDREPDYPDQVEQPSAPQEVTVSSSWATETSRAYSEISTVNVRMAHEPAARAIPTPVGAALPPARRLLDPVVYSGAEIVVVDQRTLRQKLTRQNPTDDAILDDLQRDGRPVALVYLVFVPDDDVVPKPAAKQRSAMALKLDQAFASVRWDATANRPAHVAVEVLSATSPVQKHGTIHVAGELSDSDLPKVKIEYFDILQSIESLLDAAGRTTRGLYARGVDVASVHYVFLAVMKFPDDTMDEWMELLDTARVTWIDFGPIAPRARSDGPPSYLTARSPYGLHVLTDKEDVVAVVRKQSEVLYQYETPALAAVEPSVLAGPTVVDGPEGGAPASAPLGTPPKGSRRKWPLGKKHKS